MSHLHPKRIPGLSLLAVSLTLMVAGCGGGGSKPAGTSGSGTGGAGSTTSTAASGAQPNGVASKTPDQIVASAYDAINKVSGVHVAGSIVQSGVPVSLDLHLDRPRGGEGTVSENHLPFRLIAAGQDLYILGSPGFWTHFGGASAAKLFQNKWLKVPDSGQFATLGNLVSIPTFFKQLLASHGKLVKAGQATVGGQAAVGVRDTKENGTLYVASTGQPYPLEIVKHGADGGRVSFSDFNHPVSVQAPAKSISLPGGG